MVTFSDEPTASERPWPLWLRLLILFVPGILWWVACLPGNLTYDSIGVLEQIASGDYWNNHPVAYTLYVQTVSFGGSAVWLMTLLQSIGLSAALYATGRSIGASRNLSVVSAAIIMFTPYGGPFAVTVWKDVPCTILVLAGLSLAIRATRTHSRWEWIGAVAALAVGSSFRHNGWPMLIASAVVLAVILLIRRSWDTGFRIIVALVVAGIASIGVQQAAVAVTHARSLDPWFTYQTILADLAYADAWHPDEMPPGLDAFVHRFANGDAFDRARECSVINGLIYSDGFDEVQANLVFRESLSWYAQLARTAPWYIVQARQCRAAAFLPPPMSIGPRFVYQNELSVFENDWGIRALEPVPILTSAAKAWDGVWVAGGRILAWPGLLGLLGSIALLLRLRRRTALAFTTYVWLSVTWGSLLTISLVSVSQDFRYATVPAFVGLTAVIALIGEALHRGDGEGVPVRETDPQSSDSTKK